MTMTRETKAAHRIQLDTARYAADGMTGTWFASPARRGEKMTPAEYKIHHMGRKSSAGLAAERKLTRMGFRITESGRAIKITRR